MTTDTSKITKAANDLGDGLAKGGGAAKTLGAEIANVFKALDQRVTALEAGGSTPPGPEPIPPDHPYEDLTTYYKFSSGTVTFPEKTIARCQVTNGDHAEWDSSCDFSGLSGPRFAPTANIHLDYYFKIEAGAPMTGGWVIVGEIHNDDVALGRSTSPPFSVHVDKDHLSIVAIAGGTSSSNDQWLWPYSDPNKIQRDRDYHMAVDVKFSKTGGYLRVARDGQSIVNYTGPLGYGAETYLMPDIYRAAVGETTAVVFSRMQVWTD
jgi:hypothetical protein